MPLRSHSESALRISDCVTELLRKQPFFGSLVLRLPLRPDSTRATLATDGYEIRYSPQWIASSDSHVIETAMARVVMACALKHHTRRNERDHERWQKASQLVTHSLIRDAGFTLPHDAEAWDDISVEQAYDRLSSPPQEDDPEATPDPDGTPQSDPADDRQDRSDAGEDDDSKDGEHQDDDQDGDADDDADRQADSQAGDDGNDADRQDDSQDGDGEGNQDDNADSDADGDAGGPSAQDDDAQRDRHSQGSPDQSEPDSSSSSAPPSHDPCGTGEVMDADSRATEQNDQTSEPLDVIAEEQAWDEAMHQALNIARAESKTPGRVQETIRGAHTSVLDWRTLLRRYMTDAANHDFTWAVPNRRFIDSGLYLPSIHSEGISSFAFIIDTSASLSSEALAVFWSELREIVDEIRPDSIIVLQVDEALQDVTEYAPDDLPEEIRVRGRLGTDFRPGFAWLERNAIEPGICLYFTDMECSDYPDAEPPFPVVWCDYGEPDTPWKTEPPWGELIAIDA